LLLPVLLSWPIVSSVFFFENNKLYVTASNKQTTKKIILAIITWSKFKLFIFLKSFLSKILAWSSSPGPFSLFLVWSVVVLVSLRILVFLILSLGLSRSSASSRSLFISSCSTFSFLTSLFFNGIPSRSIFNKERFSSAVKVLVSLISDNIFSLKASPNFFLISSFCKESSCLKSSFLFLSSASCFSWSSFHFLFSYSSFFACSYLSLY